MRAPLRPIPDLLTPRLRLRRCEGGDLDFLHVHWTDPRVRRFLWDDEGITRERVAEAIRASAESFDAHGYGLWIVLARETSARIGVCGLRPASWADELEIIYSLTPERWRSGFTVEAARAVLAHAFGTLFLARIVAATNPPNAASVCTLERLGMRFERRADLDGLETLFYSMSHNDFGNASLHDSPPRARSRRGVEQPGSSSGS